jgi:5-methylcytosine-specific restriction protein A
MAVTQGHGNPDWTREETILALALYFELNKVVPSERHPAVQALSRLLRSLPYHASAARKESFRNPAGVSFKLQNLQSFETGRGLKNVSQMDRDVWAEFHRNPEEAQRLASLIGAEIGFLTNNPTSTNDEDSEFYEGRLMTVLHKTRERDSRVRKRLLDFRSKNGPLNCDLCSCRPISGVPAFLDAIFEAHHLKPLSLELVKSTRLSDLALLCANCHRLVHRAISREKRWLTLEECKAALGGA